MDYHRDTGTNLWVLPRGIERKDGVGGSLSWTAKHGSLVAGAFDLMSVDGVNEAGLAGHVLWLTESDYGTHDESKPALSMAVWLQYFLDNFATVAEAAAWVEESSVQVVPLTDPGAGRCPRSTWRWTIRQVTRRSSSTSTGNRWCGMTAAIA